MLKMKTISILAIAGLVLALAPAAWAELVSDPGGFTPPAGLNEGDTYHLVFVSSTVRDATSADIADYNTHVQSAADAAGIGSGAGVTWKAIAATETVNANVNAPVSGPVYLVDGTTKVADEAAFYTGTHLVPINYNEDGSAHEEVDASPHQYDPSPTWAVWTGTFPSGDEAWNALGRTTPTSGYGYADKADNAWARWEHDGGATDQDLLLPLYGLSEALTVVVPEPATMSLLAIGGLGLLARRKRSA